MLIHMLNGGIPMCVVIDDDAPNRMLKGQIGVQCHEDAHDSGVLESPVEGTRTSHRGQRAPLMTSAVAPHLCSNA